MLILSLFFGLVDEIHQMYVPFRSFSIDDLIKDGIGVIVVYLIVHKSYFSKKTTKIGVFLKKIENPSRKKDDFKV